MTATGIPAPVAVGVVRAPRGELAAAAAVAGAAAIVLLLVGPAPGDAPAHLYRTLLARDSALLWDNLWYGGQYPFASYSLLYYVPAAVFGNLPLALLSALLSAPLFVAVAFHEWGAVTRWPGRAFALLAAAPIFTGLYAYSLGFTAMLGALRLFQRARPVAGLALGALTLGFSPLAFVFLCLILASAFVAGRRLRRTHVIVAVSLAAIAAVQAAALALFPSSGVYPFNHWDLLAMLTLCTLGIALGRRSERSRLLVAFFAVWGLGCLATFAVPTALGDNVTRLRSFVFPVMLVAAIQARFRPRPLAAVAVAAALAYNLVPYVMLIPYRLDDRPSKSAFWQSTLAFLEAHRDPAFRVEVVPTAAHWESYWVPRAGFALARGWYRQLDITDNPTLYEQPLTPAAYAGWLHALAVRYVVVPQTTLDPDGGPDEARLVKDGAAGLRLVLRSTTATIYEVPHPTPLLTGAAGATVTKLTHEAVNGDVRAAGTYLLRLRYSPYWVARPTNLCVHASRAGLTLIIARRPGSFSLSMPRKLGQIIDAIEHGGVQTHCS